MALRYCLENLYIPKTLSRCKKNDLAVVDIEGCEALVKSAVNRGVIPSGTHLFVDFEYTIAEDAV